MGKKELYELIDAYWAEYKDKTEKKSENKLRNGKYVSDYVVGSMPIVWFGDYEAYKKSDLRVVTVGLNPSNHEFEKNRFPDAVGLSDVRTDEDRDKLLKSYNNYFKNDPYDSWFEGGYGKVFKLFPEKYSVSYGYNVNHKRYRKTKNTAIHIDVFSPLATKPTWSKLEKDKDIDVDEKLKIEGIKLYKRIIDVIEPKVILFYERECMSEAVMGENRKQQYIYNTKENEEALGSYIKDGKLYLWGSMGVRIPWNTINIEDTYNGTVIKGILEEYIDSTTK